MNLYAKLEAAQRPTYQEWRSRQSFEGTRRGKRDAKLPKCAKCLSEWSVKQLLAGCPTCAAIRAVRREGR